jgi:hypothetical protein
MKENHSTVDYKGLNLDVYFDWTPEEPMVMYYKDGSGYPGSPEEFNINKVELQGIDITELVLDQFDEIEDAIQEQGDQRDY